jgi:hypothetical protein
MQRPISDGKTDFELLLGLYMQFLGNNLHGSSDFRRKLADFRRKLADFGKQFADFR